MSLCTFATWVSAQNSDTAQFQVKLTVEQGCKITATNDLDFGVIARNTRGDASSQSNLDVTCTNGTPYQVKLKGTEMMHNINQPDQVIPYQLFQTSNHDTEWNANVELSALGTGTTTHLPIYAKLDGETNVATGQYVDTVTAMLTY